MPPRENGNGAAHNLFTGKRDNTTKESVKRANNLALARTIQKNPQYVPRNKAGSKLHVASVLAEAASSVGAKGDAAAERYRNGRMPWVIDEHQRLVRLGLGHSEKCVHEPQRISRATEYIEQRQTGKEAASVKTELVYDRGTHTAARAGTYFMGGEWVFVHTDGSVARIMGKEKHDCPCGMVHYSS